MSSRIRSRPIPTAFVDKKSSQGKRIVTRHEGSKMKTILVLAVAFVVGLNGYEFSDEDKATLNAFQTSCIDETAVDKTVLDNAEDGKFDDNDDRLACFATCLLKKLGVMDADGNSDWEMIRANIPVGLPMDRIDRAINNCKDIAGDGCRKGANLIKCIVQNAISENFFNRS